MKPLHLQVVEKLFQHSAQGNQERSQTAQEDLQDIQ